MPLRIAHRPDAPSRNWESLPTNPWHILNRLSRHSVLLSTIVSSASLRPSNWSAAVLKTLNGSLILASSFLALRDAGSEDSLLKDVDFRFLFISEAIGSTSESALPVLDFSSLLITGSCEERPGSLGVGTVPLFRLHLSSGRSGESAFVSSASPVPSDSGVSSRAVVSCGLIVLFLSLVLDSPPSSSFRFVVLFPRILATRFSSFWRAISRQTASTVVYSSTYRNSTPPPKKNSAFARRR